MSRILPDVDMPHLPDGTPVDLITSLSGLPTRMNFGVVREALMGRIAKAEGQAAVVPPFQAPRDAELRERLADAGLPEDGMEILTTDKTRLLRPSTVGWVYWGRTHHIARNKLHVADREAAAQSPGEKEYAALSEAEAYEVVSELYNTSATDREDNDTLAARVAAGPVRQAGPPSPTFVDLALRLGAAGIRAEIHGETLTFGFGEPEGPSLRLARPVPHPYLPDHDLDEVGVFEQLPEYHALTEANDRLARMVESNAPDPLVTAASAQLDTRVREFFEALLRPHHIQFGARPLFCARTVIAPGRDIGFDQVGLADEIAWTLFGPLVIRELGGEEEVRGRSRLATQVLDKVMAQSWVVVYRASMMPTPFVAFRPLRSRDRTMRLHPLVCEVMDLDFDGDQAGVFLPITEDGQRDAGKRLALVAHLSRDPGLIRALCPKMDAMFGLASLGLSPQGRDEISELAGTEVATDGEIVTQRTLTDALRKILNREGAQEALEASQRLMWRGFRVAHESGASMSPFLGATLARPPEPEGDRPEQWDAYAEEILGWMNSQRAFTDNDLGPVSLMLHSGARGNIYRAAQLVGAFGNVVDVHKRLVPIRHGWREGLTPEEVFARVAGSRRGIAEAVLRSETLSRNIRRNAMPTGHGVLARARRAEHPGVVFARAADRGECDPLEDVSSRLWVGLGATR
ncbi:hypothetical protein CMK11_16700 [Candidatus Poribacteria bacterium]|nr:hypothetical protein [Candidatus Poribacteria bacterium]